MSNLKRMYDDSVPLYKLNRIVIHKTTFFTKEEMEGITKGLAGVDDIELLQIQEFTAWRAIRFDYDKIAPFPIQRGTVIPWMGTLFLFGHMEVYNMMNWQVRIKIIIKMVGEYLHRYWLNGLWVYQQLMNWLMKY